MNSEQPAVSKPKCPTTVELATQIEKLSSATVVSEANAAVINSLQWLHDFLADRKLYHKRQQLKTKHLKRLAIEAGLLDSDELKTAVDSDLQEHVANLEADDAD